MNGAKNNAYTLIVDCPANLDIGVNIDKPIFINSSTAIEFVSGGKFIVNNLFNPAFVIANSSNITLTDWNVEYNSAYATGSSKTMNYGTPVNFSTGGFYEARVWNPVTNSTGLGANGSGHFSDQVLTTWLVNNGKGMKFPNCSSVPGGSGGHCSQWLGSINVSAVFLILGDSTNVTISGLDLYASSTSDPTKFMPFAFMFGIGYKSNQTVTTSTPAVSASNAHSYFAVPTNVTISDSTVDGYMMGFQGMLSDSKFQSITAGHYSDLQDSNGNNVGGVAAGNPLGTQMPPPHLFYLDNYDGVVDSALFNTGVTLDTISDAVGSNNTSLRVGKARTIGGYADAFKFQCIKCSINNVTSLRKDGFMTIMASDTLTISNVNLTYDSGFVNNNYQTIQGTVTSWHTLRDTGTINNITFTNVKVTDASSTTQVFPIDMSGTNIVFTPLSGTTASSVFTANKWTGSGSFQGVPTGMTSGSALQYTTKSPSASVTVH